MGQRRRRRRRRRRRSSRRRRRSGGRAWRRWRCSGGGGGRGRLGRGGWRASGASLQARGEATRRLLGRGRRAVRNVVAAAASAARLLSAQGDRAEALAAGLPLLRQQVRARPRVPLPRGQRGDAPRGEQGGWRPRQVEREGFREVQGARERRGLPRKAAGGAEGPEGQGGARGRAARDLVPQPHRRCAVPRCTGWPRRGVAATLPRGAHPRCRARTGKPRARTRQASARPAVAQAGCRGARGSAPGR